ncbi:MAG: hypothetical protein R2719_09015 [Micropruina sp.]
MTTQVARGRILIRFEDDLTGQTAHRAVHGATMASRRARIAAQG